jgi:hypothetical protein
MAQAQIFAALVPAQVIPSTLCGLQIHKLSQSKFPQGTRPQEFLMYKYRVA